MKKVGVLFLSLALLLSACLFVEGPSAQAAIKKPRLNVKKLNMTVGSNYQLRVYNLKKKQKATYTSSNPTVISFEKEGASTKYTTINALSVGSSVITATVKKGSKTIRVMKCRVKACPSAVGIKFMRRQTTINIGEKQRLETIVKPNTSLEQPVYESSNPDVVSVNSRGVITAISSGTATITATLLSCNATASCTVTVVPEKGEKAPRESKSSQTKMSEKNFAGTE